MSTAASAASTFSGPGQAPASPQPPWRSPRAKFKKLYHGGHRGKTGGHGFIRTGFITSDVARVFRPAGSLAAILAGLKTCATSRERGKLGYETGCSKCATTEDTETNGGHGSFCTGKAV